MRTIFSASTCGTRTLSYLRGHSVSVRGAFSRMPSLNGPCGKRLPFENPRSLRCGWSNTDLFEDLLHGFAHQRVRIPADLLQGGDCRAGLRADLTESQGCLPADRPLRIAQGRAKCRHGVAGGGADLTQGQCGML